MPMRGRLLEEAHFRRALVRECKRADRTQDSIILVLAEISTPLMADSSSIWDAVTGALAAATRETDVLGWIEWRSVIGVVLTGVAPWEADQARVRLDARVRHELAGRLDADTMDRLSIRIRSEAEPQLLFGPEEARPRLDAYAIGKRVQDVVVSLALLILLSPLLLLIAVLVKSSSRGPVFYAQTRIGHRMKAFRMFKFRTMKCDADPALHHAFVSAFIRARDQRGAAGAGPVFKLMNDPRITPVGRVLRKASLDELPQLWNVLRGEMSLVGPRPPLPYELEQYESWHRRRVLEAKPGITGLWQVSGRSRTTFDEMVRLDLRYAKTRSFWTDLKILLATPAAVLSGEGAR
jgi:lipopolysaccharide/colanic/teichoic acid biosynthesis glycosyltransferase